MLREELLNAKAEELQAQLTEWIGRAGVLAPGEILVFSLRIERGIAVRREQHDSPPERLVPSKQGRAAWDYIAPARLVEEEIEELLAQVSRPSRDTLSTLLKVNQNAPLRIWARGEPTHELSDESVNSKLRSHPIRGKYYRLIKNCVGRSPAHEYWCQLWEVRQKAS